MTVELVESRPTPIKLLQMLRNKINIDDVQKTLKKIYVEIMGDIDELVNIYYYYNIFFKIDDKFCDDIRFSSPRSSLSIISGPRNLPKDLTDTESTLRSSIYRWIVTISLFPII